MNIVTLLRIAPYVLAALVMGSALWYRGQMLAARMDVQARESTIAELRTVNATQKAAIEELRGIRQRDTEVLLVLNNRISELVTQNERITQDLQSLERSNAEIKAYMSSPVPADVLRLLNGASRAGAAVGAGTPK